MTQFAPRWLLQAFALAVAGAALIRCSDGTEYVLQGVEGEGAAAAPLGTAGFHLDVGNGLLFNQLTYTLQLPDNTFQTKTIDLSPDDTSITIYLGELAVGSGYQVTLSATSTTGSVCTGSSKFRIKQDETVVVNVHMECSGGIANPDVGSAVIKGQIIPATGDCPAVVDRIEVAPARAGIGVPISVEVFPTPGTAPSVRFSANGGLLTVVPAVAAAAGAATGAGAGAAGTAAGAGAAGMGAGAGAAGMSAAGMGAAGTTGATPAADAANPGQDDGLVRAAASTSTRATFRCTVAGEFEIDAEVIRAGCVHNAEAIVKCFDDGTPYVPPRGGAGGQGGLGGSGGQGASGAGGVGGGMGDGTGGSAGAGNNNACSTCTAANCPAQVSACQNDPTSTACGEIRVCANVGAPESCASNSSLDCYCGTRPVATCLSFGGNGECADAITRASGCNDGRAPENIPTCVSERFLDVNFGLGDAFQLVSCQRRNCSSQCGLLQ